MNKDDFQKLDKELKLDWDIVIHYLIKLGIFFIIVYIGVLLSRLVYRFFKKIFKKTMHDDMVADFLANTIKYIFILLIVIVALNVIGYTNIANKIFAGGAAFAIIVSFALKDIGENFISGIILSFNRPFNVNDTIKVEEVFGKVQSIGFRSSKIKTYDGKDVYIPNSDIIKKPVYNYSEDGFFRMEIEINFSTSNDLDKLESEILETINTAEGVKEDDNHKTIIMIDSMNSTTVTYKGLFWISTTIYPSEPLRVKSNVYKALKKIFMDKDLEFPSGIQSIKIEGANPFITKTPEKN